VAAEELEYGFWIRLKSTLKARPGLPLIEGYTGASCVDSKQRDVRSAMALLTARMELLELASKKGLTSR